MADIEASVLAKLKNKAKALGISYQQCLQLPDFETPVIKTYSLESTIAEKFDAILQRFELTSRMKDFYDIYYLSRTFYLEERYEEMVKSERRY